MTPEVRPHPLALVALLAANLVPLAGVLFLGWDLALVLYLFWAESGVVGLFAIAKLPWVAGPGAVLLVPFFCVHFGLFMTVHAAFLGLLTSRDLAGGFGRFPLAVFERMQPHWALALGGLVASHGVSFVVHFLRPRAWASMSMSDVMRTPYQRVVILHVTILVGAGLVLLLGAPAWSLVLLVILKIGVDVTAHRKEHGAGPRGQGARP